MADAKPTTVEDLNATYVILEDVFTDNGGDIAKLAAAIEGDAALMDSSKPADAADFVKMVLGGAYHREFVSREFLAHICNFPSPIRPRARQLIRFFACSQFCSHLIRLQNRLRFL